MHGSVLSVRGRNFDALVYVKVMATFACKELDNRSGQAHITAAQSIFMADEPCIFMNIRTGTSGKYKNESLCHPLV